MSILDALKNVDPATAQGLLQMGLSMLQSKGSLANAIGQGGMAGIQGANQFRDRQAQTQQRGLMEQLQKQQLASGQRQQQLEALPSQFYRAPSAQGVDATGGMETADTNPANAFNPRGSFDEQGYQQALMGMSPMQGLQFKAATTKQRPELKAFKPGDVVGAQDASGAFKEQFRVPEKADKANEDQFISRMIAAGIDPKSPRGQQLLNQRLVKEATHTPPVSIANYGSPLPVDLGGGQTGYIQPPTRPGGPTQVLQVPGTGKPALKPKESADKPPTEFESKAGLYFKSMKNATEKLDDIESTNAWRPGIIEAAAPGDTMKSLAAPEKRQAYVQAQKQWIDSINRVRSGANLPELEYHRAVSTFFPIFGEGENIKKQKAAARKQEEQAMSAAAGRALPKSEVGWGDLK